MSKLFLFVICYEFKKKNKIINSKKEVSTFG